MSEQSRYIFPDMPFILMYLKKENKKSLLIVLSSHKLGWYHFAFVQRWSGSSGCFCRQQCLRHHNGASEQVKPKKKRCLFPVTWPSLGNGPIPRHFYLFFFANLIFSPGKICFCNNKNFFKSWPTYPYLFEHVTGNKYLRVKITLFIF